MEIKSGKASLSFTETGKIISFSSNSKYEGFRPFKICVQGEAEGQFSEYTSANCTYSERFIFEGVKQNGEGCVLNYYDDRNNLRVEVEVIPISDTGVLRICSTVKNVGENSVEITRFSSAFVTGFGGGISQKTPDFNVHYFESCWQAEARYVKKSIKELGLTFVSTHPMVKTFTLLSQGAYTTGKYFPSIYLEDVKKKKMRFISAECDGGWRIQLGHSAGYVGQNAGWYLESDAISASDIATSLMLDGGEDYTSPAILVGFVDGGFDEATEALTRARRELYRSEIAPLMFNDYMDCLWCNVNDEITEKLAKKAANLGAEGYCIDSGWFCALHNNYGKLGDWTPNNERFLNGGLKGTLAKIKELGLVPGVWTELEVCSKNAEAFNLPDEYFITSNGRRVGGEDRYFFDMSNPKVCEYLTNKIEALYDIGVRYVKNDFNAALRWSTDANVVYKNQRASMEFYKSIKERFPDLIIENCGSGGLRADYGMLKYFSIQSTSDQEIYYLNPPIIQGMVANILPEHAGIWSYPYPHLFDDRLDETAILKDAESLSNGKQTIFNMVNGLAGNLYLSGRIDYADDFNNKLIKEGVELFKGIREFKYDATAVYPNGFSDISNLGNFATMGLINREKDRMLLFVWKFEGNSTLEVPVKKWDRGSTVVKRIYPSVDGINATYCESEGCVRMQAKDDFIASIFELTF